MVTEKKPMFVLGVLVQKDTQKNYEYKWKKVLLYFFICLAIVVFTFPEIVFKKGNFRNIDNIETLGQGSREIVSFYEERTRPVHFGYSDPGGACWQSEPAQYFLKNSLWNFQTPFWNPYVGAGIPGVEGLVDLTFSPLATIMAVFKGDANTYHTMMLLTFLVGLFFLMMFFSDILGLSLGASVAGSIVFLLNGVHIANLNSNVIQPYLYFPIVLYAAFKFIRKFNLGSYIFLVLSICLPLMATFIPTLALVITCVYLFSAAFIFQADCEVKTKLKRLIFFSSAFGVAFLILAFIYLPVVEHLFSNGVLDTYQQRIYFPVNRDAFLSFFSSRHFWESYYGSGNAEAVFGAASYMFHFGILACMVASQMVFRSSVHKVLKWTVLGVFAVAFFRIFGVSPISNIIDLIPFFSHVGSQYWFVALSIPFVLLVAFGFEDITKGQISPIKWRIVGLVVIMSMVYLVKVHGLKANSPLLEYENYSAKHGVLNIALIFFFLFIGPFLIRASVAKKKFKSLFLVLLLVCIFAEYMFYMNHQRYKRVDVVKNPPNYIEYIQKNIGLHRMMNIGMFGVFPNWGGAFGIQQLESMTMSNSSLYYNFMHKYLIPKADSWTIFIALRRQTEEPIIESRFLDLLNVKFVVVNRGMDKYETLFQEKFPKVFENTQIKIFENPTVYDRIFVAHRFLYSKESLRDFHFDFNKVAVTDDEKLVEQAKLYKIPNVEVSDLPQSGAGSASVEEYQNGYVRAKVSLAEPGVVVLMDNWHPGWKVYVNGKQAYLGKVFESFRGVVLDKGDYIVEYRYSPRTLPVALVISFLALLTLVCSYIFRKPINAAIGRALSL